MVSLTFDEFHALRTRQRAAEAEAARSSSSKGSGLASTSMKSGAPAQNPDDAAREATGDTRTQSGKRLDDELRVPTSGSVSGIP